MRQTDGRTDGRTKPVMRLLGLPHNKVAGHHRSELSRYSFTVGRCRKLAGDIYRIRVNTLKSPQILGEMHHARRN